MYQKKLDPDMDLNLYFESREYHTLPIGEVFFPTGKVIVADPLYSLPYGGTAPFTERIKKGSYPVLLSVKSTEDYGDRYMAAKLCLNEKRAVRFQLALKPGEQYQKLKEDEIYGFPVETGLASFCDGQVQKEFAVFCEAFSKEHPDGNLYDDYFAQVFDDSYQLHPKFQRPGGDWVNWTVPGSRGNIIMFNSGFGDGVYPAYWGYDKDGYLCSLIIQFISPAEFEEV